MMSPDILAAEKVSLLMEARNFQSKLHETNDPVELEEIIRRFVFTADKTWLKLYEHNKLTLR